MISNAGRLSVGSVLALFAAAVVLLATPVARSAVASTAVATPVVDASTPIALIQSSSKIMLDDLDSNRARYRKDPTDLYKLVDRILLPNFDVDFAGQQVLGKHWRAADAQQRKRFVTAFYQSLLHTYGDALVDFTGDRLRVLPFQGDINAPRATVRSEVRRSNGSTVAVNYSMRKSPEGVWKAWDVVIEGISYVKSFREDYGPEIDQKGLESLIKRLEASGGLKSAAK
jgi:phospholipid transport system substrate-binding protein